MRCMLHCPLWVTILLLSWAPTCFTFRNMTDPSRLVLGTVMSLSSSTISDGTVLNADSSRILQGYRFWVDRTNDAGGVLLNGHRVPVELQYYNDESDPSRTEQLFQQLVDSGVDVLLGGLPRTTAALSQVSRRNSVLALACCTELENPVSEHPWFFGISAQQSPKTADLLQAAASDGVRSLGILAASDDRSARSLCNATKRRAETLGIDVVFEGEFEAATANRPAMEAVFRSMRETKPQALVACTVENDALELVRAAVATTTLQGSEVPGSALYPGWVDAPFLQLMMLSNTPHRSSLKASLGGFVHGMITAQPWHHALNFTDPFFGSTAALDAEWMARHDFGQGEHMSSLTASAIAIGVVLRIGLERSGYMDLSALQEGLRSLDSETFFGRLEMRGSQRIHTPPPVTTQWDCSSGVCTDRIAVTSETHSSLHPFPASCPRGTLRKVAARGGEAAAECVPCMALEPASVQTILQSGGERAAVLRESCEALGSSVSVGVAVWSQQQQLVAAMEAGLQLIRLDPFILPNIEIELVTIDNASAASALQPTRDLAAVVWGGSAGKEWESTSSDASHEAGLMISVGSETLSMHVAYELQGRAMAFFVKELGWSFCHLVACSSAACHAMAAEFRRDASAYGIDVIEAEREGREPMPSDYDAASTWTLEGLLVDACAGSVYVLCVDLGLAEAITSKIRDYPDLKQLVMVGPEALTRVSDPQPGTIAVSLSAEPAEWDNRSADAWSTMLAELEGREWAEGRAEWLRTHGAWTQVEPLALEALDAVMWVARLLDSKLRSDASFSGDANLAAEIRATEQYGVTGRMAFGEDMQRSSGRLGMVVHKDGEWQQKAIWDMESPSALLFDTGRYATKERWIEDEVSSHEDGMVPPQCPCEFWTRMPPGSSALTCKWSPTAIGVVSAASVLLVAAVGLLLWKRRGRRFEDAETREVHAQMQRLRKLLGLQKRRGFKLSSEQSSFARAPSSSEPSHHNYNIIPRNHLEALAKMSLLLPFQTSQMDHFCAWLHSLDSSGRRRNSDAIPAGNVNLDTEAGPVSNWRYAVLCKLILDTSAQLLSPDVEDEEPIMVDDESRADVSRPNTPELTSRQSSNVWKHQPETQEERFKYFKEHVGQLRIWGYRNSALFLELKEIVQEYLNDIHLRLHSRYLEMLEEDGGQELVELEWSEDDWWMRSDAEDRFKQCEAEHGGDGDVSDASNRSCEGKGAMERQESEGMLCRRKLPPSLSVQTISNGDEHSGGEEDKAGAECGEEDDSGRSKRLAQFGSYAALIKSLESDGDQEHQPRALIARSASSATSCTVDETAVNSLESITRMASLTPQHSAVLASIRGTETDRASAGTCSPPPAGTPAITRATGGSANTSVSLSLSRRGSAQTDGHRSFSRRRSRPGTWGGMHKSMGNFFGDGAEGSNDGGSNENSTHSLRQEEVASVSSRKLHSAADVPMPVALQNLEVEHVSMRWDGPDSGSGKKKAESTQKKRWRRLKKFAQTQEGDPARRSLGRRRRHSSSTASMYCNNPRKLSIAKQTPAASKRSARRSSEMALEVFTRERSGNSDEEPRTPGSTVPNSPLFSRRWSQHSDNSAEISVRGSKGRDSKTGEEETGSVADRLLKTLKQFRPPWSKETEAGDAQHESGSGRDTQLIAAMNRVQDRIEHFENGIKTSKRRRSSIIGADHHLPPTFLQSPSRAVSGAPEHEAPHASDAVRMFLRQDHPLVRAIRVDEQDEAEAMIEWEGGETMNRQGSNPKRVEEDVFISQLHRRAELLNDGFLQQLKQIVEAHRPTDFASTPAMAKIKAMAWLDTNKEELDSPRNCASRQSSDSPFTFSRGNLFSISFSSRNRHTNADPAQPDEEKHAAHAGGKDSSNPLSGAGVLGSRPRSWLNPRRRRSSASQAPARCSSASALEGAEAAAGAGAGVKGATAGGGERMRMVSEHGPARPLWADSAPPSIERALSVPIGAEDPTGACADAKVESSREAASGGLVSKLNTGFQRLRRQSSLLLGGLTGGAQSPLERAASKARLRYGDLLDRQAGAASEAASNGAADDAAAMGDSRRCLAGGYAQRVSSDPLSFQSQSRRKLKLSATGWTSLGKLTEQVREDDARSQSEHSGEDLWNGNGHGSGSAGHPTEENNLLSKNWKALKDIIPRRTKAAFLRLSSVRAQGNALVDLVKTNRDDWKYRVLGAPVKTKERMREKLLEYAKRGEMMRPFTANILDPVRATVVCDGPRQILRAVDWFLHNTDPKLPPMPIVRVKNKFSLEDASEYDGYRDLMVCVVHTGKKGLRIIGEIQFHDAKLHALKLKMHKLYKVKRAEGANLI